MDNLTKRRIIAIIGMIIALAGLSALIWGILKRDTDGAAGRLFWILIAYVFFTVLIKKMKESSDKQALELK